MKPELRKRILEYNRNAAERTEKAGDLDVIVEAFSKLPPGQLKKVLTDDVLAVFSKYGIDLEE